MCLLAWFISYYVFVACVVAFVSHVFCLFGCGLLLIHLCVVVFVV